MQSSTSQKTRAICWADIDIKKLISELNHLAQSIGLVSNPSFEVFAKEKQNDQPINFIFVDKSANILARLRPKHRVEVERLKTNLELVLELIEAGAPLVPPSYNQACSLTDFYATFWQFGKNRPITPQEMAKSLRKIHQTPVRVHLKDHLQHKYLSKLNRLPDLTNLPSQLLGQVNQYSAQALKDLAKLYEKAPKRLIHGDSHPYNFVELNGRILACDTDDLSSGPIEADFVTPFHHAQYYPKADRSMGQKLLEAYSGQIDDQLLEALLKVKAIGRLIDAGHNPDLFEQRWHSIINNQPFSKLIGAESHTYFAATSY